MNVVSFYAPRPEHPFFQDYTPFLNLLRLSCERFGHRHIVLTDDPAVGDDAYVTDLPRSLMKATIAAQLAYLSDPQFAGVPTLLTGADCVLANDPEAMAWHGSDLTITTDDRFQDCRMNCGAIYIPRPGLLAHVWVDALARCGDEWGDDQTSVYAALLASEAVVHDLPCDPYNLAPEHPGDDCRRAVVLHFRGPRKRWMVDYCHKWLDLGDGVTALALPNATDAETLANVRTNSARDLQWNRGILWITQREAHNGHAVLVGGGPSLAETLPEIRRRKADGQTIFALNGTAAYLVNNDLYPDFGIILDPRQENVRFIKAAPGIRWLLASQCHPDLFECASRPAVWHFAGDGVLDAIPEIHRDAAMLIGGGLTVGLTAMGLVFALGYRAIHLYGYDSSDRAEAAHAYAQIEDPAEIKRVTAWCEGQSFVSGIAMYAQAEAFPRWASLLTDHGAIITVHGDGLLPTIAHAMQHAAAKELAA
jgi:hypothetical protein